MDLALGRLFASITPPSGGVPDKPFYAVKPASAYPNHYIGKDPDSLACLLIATADGAARFLPPIRLETLDVQFDLACHVKKDQEPKREGTFTVIRCRTAETETVRYFLSVCESASLAMRRPAPPSGQPSTAWPPSLPSCSSRQRGH